MATQDKTLTEAARAIADGTPLAWNDLEKSSLDEAQVESLRLLDDVAALFRTDQKDAAGARRNVMFRWGGLEVESLLGRGGYGDVYRAFDPWLGRHVALKLFPVTSPGGDGLGEARRLAKVRHRNVLSVYGSALHDGRAGIWSELIDGKTLAAAVATEGAFSAEEAARIGRDLAQALNAVHAAGLVHGDVKAENVMREKGGRIVLMDFGAGGDARLLASQRLISGTPRYLPPEVLDGAPLSATSDVFALGVLIFLLLSGQHPYKAVDPAALREEQRSGSRLPLQALRPDIEPRLSAIVESCLAFDPALRPGGDLAAMFSGALPPTSRRNHFAIIAIAAGAALLIATPIYLRTQWFPAWNSAARFLRVDALGDTELSADATLRVGDRLRLRLDTSRDAYVYLLNEDADGNASVLYPTAGSPAAVPGGKTLVLPGGDGSTLAWEVTAESSREEFVVIASIEPQPALDAEIVKWRRAAASPSDTRAVTSLVDVPRPQLQGEHLRTVLSSLPADKEHVRVWHFVFLHDS